MVLSKKALVYTALTAYLCSAAAAITTEELKSGIDRTAGKLRDISFSVTVMERNKDALTKMDEEYAAIYELKAAKVCLKEPGMLRTEGKLGMVKFEYIINGWRKIVRAPLIKLKRESDYTGRPGKLMIPFDFGLVTSSLWNTRTVEIEEDAEASNASEIKTAIRWSGSDTHILAWFDAKHFFLKRIERHDENGAVRFRIVYLDHNNPEGVIWIPTRAEMYTPEGTRVAVSEISDIKVNVGLPDSLFR